MAKGPGDCDLCGRRTPRKFLTRRYCVPKGIRGTLVRGEIARPCVSCHTMVHHVYTHKTLRSNYATVAALRAAPELQGFVAEVRERPVTGVLKFTTRGPRY